MIDVIKQQFNPSMPDEVKLNRAREFLQVACLKIMHDKGRLNDLAFLGGTALRLLFGIRRFSEDLDFSLAAKGKYDFAALCAELEREFGLMGLSLEANPEHEKTVYSVMLKFSGLLKDLGLSPLKGQKFSIKLEIDSNPPAGWKAEQSVINRTYIFAVSHYDLPSLFARKLHACFYRPYTKGRDLYDLIWHLGKKFQPNFILLNNAITQTQGKPSGIDESNFKEYLLGAIDKMDLPAARRDVERFLEDKTELALFDHNLLRNIVQNWEGKS